MVTEREHEADGPTVGAAAWGVVRATGRAGRRGVRRLHRWNRSGGAGESGLARLVEVHALQTGGDAFVTVALAGSLFFSVSPDAARSRIALYLIVAMTPFAVLAPVLGPLLDRFRHGRRYAIAATMFARAALALTIGHALAGGGLTLAETFALYPAALGVLVGQKTYTIARSATVPRLLPQMSLVQANSRLTVTGVFASAVAGGLAILVTKAAGHLWALRLGALVYVAAGVLSLRLPRHADGGPGLRAHEMRPALGSVMRLGQVDAQIAGVLRSAVTLRWLAGFLLFYGAFVVQEHSIGGMPKAVALGALAVGLGGGNFLGTVVGARTAGVAAPRLAVALLSVTALTTFFTALNFGLLTVFGVAIVSAATAAISKLGLDATIQRRVDEHARTSTFARSETAMQLSWVVGGFVGILLPTRPIVGFAVATAVVVLGLVVAIQFVRGRRPPAHPAPAG